jgi:hypothetical protein
MFSLKHVVHFVLTKRNNQQMTGEGALEEQKLRLDPQQARALQWFAKGIADIGGPQAIGAKVKATHAASELKKSILSLAQRAVLQRFSDGLVSVLICEGMDKLNGAEVPERMPELPELESDSNVLLVAARNQILLELVDHKSFAYDIDNSSKLVRLVGNFKGGGATKIETEPGKIELSSHSGLALGPHTEGPYWCSVKAVDGHSPAPSAFVLSAIWNPRNEPTTVIPMAPVLEKLGFATTLALTSKSFNFARSDSFNEGEGEDGKSASIVDFDEHCGFAVRFNSYRFTVDSRAPQFVKSAYEKLCQGVAEADAIKHALSQESAMVINNCRALHCRDLVEDNRRLLVRLFGSSKFAQPVALSQEPLILRG